MLARPARLAILLLAGSGCSGCRRAHPFVPYSIDGEVPAVSPSALAAAGASDAGPSAALTPYTAPPDTKTWSVGGLSLVAPTTTTFVQALVWDVDGDAQSDAVALVRSTEADGRLELLFFHSGPSGLEPPQHLETRGALLPSGPCAHEEHLARVGRQSFTATATRTCTSDAGPPAKSGGLVEAAWENGMKVRLAFPWVDPPGAPPLAFDVSGADSDGDGLDDLALTVTLEGSAPPFEPGPKVSARFVWLDRPTGMAREPDEPERSFESIARTALTDVAGGKGVFAAAALARQGEALFRDVCGESERRRVSPPPGESPLACEAGRALEKLRLVRVRAWTVAGDPVRAVAALDDADQPPATHTPADRTEASRWIAQVAPAADAVTLRAIRAVPRAASEAVAWSPLRFESTGSLLVETPGGVVRVEPTRGDETAAPDVPFWPSAVASPTSGERLEGARAPCTGAALVLMLTARDGGETTDVPVPVPASPSAPCGGGPDPTLLPLSWNAEGLTAVVQGEPVLVTTAGHKAAPLARMPIAPGQPGSPVSPDGSSVVIPTSEGLLVHRERWRLLHAKELENGYRELKGCTVSDDGSRVACVRGGLAFAGIWPFP